LRYWTGLPEVNFRKDARAEGRTLCALDEPEPHISVAVMSTGSQISVSLIKGSCLSLVLLLESHMSQAVYSVFLF
jgi:hypothetical protein